MTPAEKSSVAVAGVVLCGGLSSRMGQPKAWLEYNGETFLRRIARVLGLVVSPVCVVAAVGQEIPPLPASILVVRDHQPIEGPMMGLISAMQELTNMTDFFLVTSCDLPLLNVEMCQWLTHQVTDDVLDIVCSVNGGEIQPLFSVYHRRLLPTLKERFAHGERSLRRLMSEVNTKKVDVPSHLSQFLVNINSPEEYQQLLAQQCD